MTQKQWFVIQQCELKPFTAILSFQPLPTSTTTWNQTKYSNFRWFDYIPLCVIWELFAMTITFIIPYNASLNVEYNFLKNHIFEKCLRNLPKILFGGNFSRQPMKNKLKYVQVIV